MGRLPLSSGAQGLPRALWTALALALALLPLCRGTEHNPLLAAARLDLLGPDSGTPALPLGCKPAGSGSSLALRAPRPVGTRGPCTARLAAAEAGPDGALIGSWSGQVRSRSRRAPPPGRCCRRTHSDRAVLLVPSVMIAPQLMHARPTPILCAGRAAE